MTPSEWTDARISDAFGRLDARMATLEKTAVELARFEVEARASLVAVKEDTTECRSGVESLRNSIETRRDEERTERKSDRRWLTGTVLSSAGLVIAAISLLAGKIG